jgi:hypothetical protein
LSSEQKDFLKRAKDQSLPIDFDQTNPKNHGSASWERYEKYKRAKTLRAVVSLGGKSADIPYDYTRGFLAFPGAGAFSRFRLMDDGDGKVGGGSGHSSPKAGSALFSPSAASPRAQSSAPKRPEEVAPARSATSPTAPLPASAWEVTAEDSVAAGHRSGGVPGDDGDGDEDDGDEGPEVAAARAALALYDAGSFDEVPEALEALADVDGSLRRRLEAVLRLKTVDPASLKSALHRSGPESGGDGAGGLGGGGGGEDGGRSATRRRSVSIAGDLPSRHGGLEAKRDLAKESRSLLEARHEAKGVGFMFDHLLKDTLDALEESLSQPALPAAEPGLEETVEVKYAFKDVIETFVLHRDGAIPSHAAFVQPAGSPAVPWRRRKAADVAALVRLVHAAAETAKGDPTGRALNFPHLLNRFSKGGATALLLCARADPGVAPPLPGYAHKDADSFMALAPFCAMR